MLICDIIGASLNKPHTSWKNGTSISFTKIYMKIRINGMSVIRSQKFTFKNWTITYKCFQMCVHHTNDYQSSLLTPLIRLVCVFIT